MEGLDDVKDFAVMEKSMTDCGLTPAEKSNVFRVTSAVLHIGNIAFKVRVMGFQMLEAVLFKLWHVCVKNIIISTSASCKFKPGCNPCCFVPVNLAGSGRGFITIDKYLTKKHCEA